MSDDMFGDSVYESGDAVDDADDVDATGNDDTDEDLQTGYSPPEREPHNLRYSRTLAEEHEGGSLDEELAAEVPDVGAGEDYTDADPRAGRLVAPDEGAHADEESDEIASDVGPAGYASSAEEAAMHVVDEDEPADS